jgi:hypothetical protein
MKNTTELLELAGYTETQIDRYAKCLKRKKAGTLTIADRRFYLAAQGAARKAEGALELALREAQTRKVSGRQPVETKLHYRWQLAELEIVRNLVDLTSGEVSALVIILEEYLRAMSKYQPVLNQIDTTKRHKFNDLERDLLEIAAGLGRVAPLDVATLNAELQAVFPDSWNPAWDKYYSARCNLNAMFSDTEELEYRAVVRAEMERAVREIYPSVLAVA